MRHRASQPPVSARNVQEPSSSRLSRRNALRNEPTGSTIRSECGNFIVRARKDKPPPPTRPRSAADRTSRISVNASAAVGARGRAVGGRNHRAAGRGSRRRCMDAGYEDITLHRRRRTTCAGEASARTRRFSAACSSGRTVLAAWTRRRQRQSGSQREHPWDRRMLLRQSPERLD
jgi:hypothetical protein